MKSLLLSLALLLLGVTSHAADLKIVAAENFYGGIAQQIAGPDAKVTSILSNPNQDPHEFTTSPSTAREVADADIIIYNGIGYDDWMDKLLATGGKKDRVVLCVATLKGAKAGDNPHLWYSLDTMITFAKQLTKALSTRNPGQAAVYKSHYDDFITSLDPLMDICDHLMITSYQVNVTATEPVFGYMAGRLGFTMLNYDFQLKVMNDTEPAPAETAAFEKTLTSHQAKILFYNSQVTDPATERLKAIAQKAGIPIIGVTETQPAKYKTYADWMAAQLDEVKAALQKPPAN